ncbi:MAG TPA: ABC transporter permease [Candidatus Acidoferrum sp.]|nr:ABC transporter permease [Candidatus Acidoferrum sp.]
MHQLIQDLRYALRQSGKNLGVTLAVVLVLAFGIAANAVTFTVLKATLLRPLPYPNPDRLVQLWNSRDKGTASSFEFSYPDFVDYRDHNDVFEILDGYSNRGATVRGPQGAERLILTVCGAKFFDVLQVKPSLGRLFLPLEDLPQGQLSAVLSYKGWHRRFGGDPGIVGKTIVINDEPRTIVGVLPREFVFAPSNSTEIWMPVRILGWMQRRNAHWFHPVGRLKPGVNLRQAQAALSNFAIQLGREYPDSNADLRVQVADLREDIVGPVRPVLVLLMAVMGCFLLIICGNLAGLLLTQSIGRQKEISIRLALGARRWRIMRQLLTESCVLSVFGGLAGAALSIWLLPTTLASIPKDVLMAMPAWQGLHVDFGFLLVALALAVLTGIIFGLAPALLSFRPQLRATLQESGRSSAGRGRNRLRNVLVVAEIALVVVLLHGGGLMLKSLATVLHVDPGFETNNLLTMSIGLPNKKYSKDADLVAFHHNLLEKLNALPGVLSAGEIDTLPLTGGRNTSMFVREGHRSATNKEAIEANSRDISPNYFTVMHIPLRAGRFLDERDRGASPHVVIINQTLADRAFPHEDPIGKRIDFTFSKVPNLWEIVGIVGDENATALDAKPNPIIYDSMAQSPDSNVSVVVRTKVPPQSLSLSVQQVIREIDPDVPISDVETMSQMISESPSIFLRRTSAYLIAAFAGLGLVLAAVGLYSLLAYGVSQRTRELGIRLALGAQPRDVFRLIIGGGSRLAVAGVVLGAAAALGVSQLIATFLFGVKPDDAATLIAVSVLMFLVASLATAHPARRATRVDPMVVLREE